LANELAGYGFLAVTNRYNYQRNKALRQETCRRKNIDDEMLPASEMARKGRKD
jgi:hypothetical protein